MAQTVKNSDEFVKAFEKLGVDLRADITKAIFPTEKTNPKNEYLKRLKSEGITLENIRAANAEQAGQIAPYIKATGGEIPQI